MGTVISFPFPKPSYNRPAETGRHGPATIIVLPVIRIERWPEASQLKSSVALAKASGQRQRVRPTE